MKGTPLQCPLSPTAPAEGTAASNPAEHTFVGLFPRSPGGQQGHQVLMPSSSTAAARVPHTWGREANGATHSKTSPGCQGWHSLNLPGLCSLLPATSPTAPPADPHKQLHRGSPSLRVSVQLNVCSCSQSLTLNHKISRNLWES